MSARAGLAQAQRMPAALASAHYFDVDELSFQQLLVLALDSADRVGFDGGASWKEYFANDETVIIAEILATRVQGLREQFELRLADAAAARAEPGTVQAPERQPSWLLFQWEAQLRRWSEALQRHGGAGGADLGAMLAGLRQKMAGLDSIVAYYGSGPGAAPADNPELRPLMHQLVKSLEMIQRAAARRLPQTLATGQHDPGVGMLIAFAQLYRAAQDKLNRFTERHLDFYYEQVLRVQPRGPVADAAFLVFAPGAPGSAVHVPGGTRFLAPYERGAPELEFETRHDMVVSDAAVLAMHTVFFERNPQSFPEARLTEEIHGRMRPYPTNCLLNRIAPLSTEQALKPGGSLPAPLFGAPRTAVMAPPGAIARLGFALASNVLLLGDGERSITVVLHLGHELGASAGTPNTLGQRLARLLALQAGLDADVQDRVLNRMFNISLSGSEGWFGAGEYSARFEAAPAERFGADRLVIQFRLGADAPAVVAYSPVLHGGHYPGACPVLRFELNSLGYLYPYGLLRGLPLIKATLTVNVRGHRALDLQNNIGLLSASAPFQPFGPIPAAGSYLIVGSAEAACKRLSSAELVLEWGALPQGLGGFGAYYAGYAADDEPSPFQDVRASLSVLSDGAWVPGLDSERATVTLFGAAPGPVEAPAAAAAVVDFRPVLPLVRRIGPAANGVRFVYTPGARGGFFKITLGPQPFLFGHRAYSFVLADALSHNGQRRNRMRLRALPQPPYTPLLDAVSLDYEASASIVAAPSAAGDAFLRLSPLGWDAARAHETDGDLLLPRFDDAGNLYIGLSASDLRAPLTLFFHLREDALPMVELAHRTLRWSYLADNRWRRMPAHAVRADSTHAFLRAGIVTLTLPPDINRNNTELPSELYWLRVSCDCDLERFCSLYSVSTHAAQVWRVPGSGDPARAPASIAPGTITRPRQAIAGLGRVTQVNPSYGGRLAESRNDMRRRTAERLRHKGQAITPDDYERLILERFPEIDRVKCFPNRSIEHGPDGRSCPGHVLIVGLPAHRSRGHLDEFPRLNGYLIGQVRQFITAHVSPAVTLEVVNPVYQHIQVRCAVVLRAGADPGWYVNMLDEVISDFISPWSGTGNTCHFGWCIRRHDIESFILAQDGVLAVHGFSMLSVSGRAGDRYALEDSAVKSKGEEPQIAPVYPWSIAVPIKRHHITVIQANAAAAPAPTGIGKLEVGSTFIIGADE